LQLRRLLTRFQFAGRVTAGRFVGISFLAATCIVTLFVARNVSRVPLNDELCNVPLVLGELPFSLNRYWSQHNEHRIPLPRILYVLAVRAAGNDFRAAPFVSILLLAAATGFLLGMVRQIRGDWAYSDALLPIVLLSIGQYSNLLWGFQIQFTSSTALILVALGLAAAPGLASSSRRLAGFGACGILLPLCGANGVALAPGIGAALLFLGAWNLSQRQRNWTAGTLALIMGAAVFGLLYAYFHDLHDSPHHQALHGTLEQTIVGTINLFGAAFGPAARFFSPPPYNGIALVSVLAVAVVVATARLLLRAAIDPARRIQAIALGGVLIGFFGLAGGVAHARGGSTNVLDTNRYVTLMLPVVVGAYVAWAALGGRRMPRALFAIVAALAVPNALIGMRDVRQYLQTPRQVDYQIRIGLPLEFVVDRNPLLFHGEPRFRREVLKLLNVKEVEPFRRARPMPRLSEEAVPLRVIRSENMICEGGSFRSTGAIGHVVLALPRRQFLYGFRLKYEASAGAVAGMPNLLSWETDGGTPRSDATGVVSQLEPVAAPAETLVFVNCEAGSLRIDLFGEGATIVVHSLVLLTRSD
jgi:hypothetical protein